MKKDIILAGVGGQGILSIAAIIDLAALKSNLHMKQSEVHGMSQRGGVVQSHLRISDQEIYSDLIPKGSADLILSVEPLEALRYTSYLSGNGVIVSSINPFKNIPNYPNEQEVYDEFKMYENCVLVDAEKIAKDCGSLRTANIVMLGAASKFMGLETELFEKCIIDLFKKKGEDIVEMNLRAYRLGLNGN